MAILFGLCGLGKYGLPPQEQLLVAGTAFGGPDDTYGGVMGAWDFQLPKTERFFLSSIGSIGHYQKQRAYTALSFEPGVPRRGSNDSDEDDFVVTPGDNYWSDFRLEYVVPIGGPRKQALMSDEGSSTWVMFGHPF